jgi:ubiquinone biosynthesis protein
VASASIAQVHRAQLTTGEIVAVKVRRPGIDRIVAQDLDALRQLARLLAGHMPAVRAIDPPGLVEEFARTIRAELDLAREGRNVERCARNFTGDPTVRIPRVFWEHTTASVLTMEYLDGVRLADLTEAGVGPFAKRRIARRGADAILAQILLHGFFHADPHPGNIVVLPDQVIGFLDFGIVGRVDETLRAHLANIIRAVWRRDAKALAALAVDLTRPLDEVSVPALTEDLAWLLDAYADVPLGDLPMIDVLADVVRTAARHRLRIPANLMLLIKAVTTIEAVGRWLDPDFKIVRHAVPLAERLFRLESSPAALATHAGRSMQEIASAVRALPLHLDAIGRRAREGRLQVQFVHRNLEHFVSEMDRSSNRIAFALVIASIVVGSSLVMQTTGATMYGYPVLGLAGFLSAGLLGVGLAVGIVRSGRL